jgi:uncharacterized protein YegP (UPF0339 family)/uncharacterized membrane-anchored protein YhcB (DUF1043 family)
MLQFFKNFFDAMFNEWIYLTLSIILFLVVLVTLLIVRHMRKKKENAKKIQAEFKEKSVMSLTPEEIENISKNSANPTEVKQYLTDEVELVKRESAKSKEETAKKQAVKKPKSAQPKKAKEQPKTEAKKQQKPKTEVLEVKEDQAKVEKPTQKTTAKPAKKQYTGKWKIVQEDDGFIAILTASNGGTLLKTEKYKTVSNVKNGIETIKKNIDGGNFAISVDKYGHYRFKLYNLSNRLICMSEDYSSKAKCESGIESVKRFAQTASVIQEEM